MTNRTIPQNYPDTSSINNPTGQKARTNEIETLFANKSRNILSVYFTAGFPGREDTAVIMKALQDRGVDMIEVGIPFSDPMADGPAIQSSSTAALKNGMSLKLLFRQLENIREYIRIPVLLMGYLNPIMQFGFENFCRSCANVGVDGVIVPDLPFADYLADYKPLADAYGLKMIMLITPETSEERIRLIDEHTDGFIYMVSSASVTGAQRSFDNDKQEYFRRIERMNLRNPRLVGFGISNRETYEAAAAHSAGAIVGSAFIRLLGEEPDAEHAVDALMKQLSITQ